METARKNASRAEEIGNSPQTDNGLYDDIISLPHHISTKHPQMSALDRAAQFSPFAALTGYGAVIEETARLTEEEAEHRQTGLFTDA